MLRSAYKNVCNFIVRSYSLRSVETPFMGKPILYGDEISPPVRFVMMTASALGIDLDFRKIDLFKNENRSDFFKQINPMQKVPAMVIADTTICDSHAISLYLCQIVNSSELYPKKPLLRAKITELMFFNSSTLFRIDSEIFSAYFSNQWPVNKKKIEDWLLSLDYLEYQLNRNVWLAGTKMYLCDICAVPVVTSMMQIIPLTERHHKVNQWLKRFEEYPFYEKNKEGLSSLRSCIERSKNVHI